MKRPQSITLVSAIFILVGTAGLLADLWPLVTSGGAAQLAKLRADGLADVAPAWGLRLLAIVGGVALRGGHNWARWFLAAWMLIHVGISLFHSLAEVLAHCAIFGPLCYAMFRAPTQPFFDVPKGAVA
jgi:hypothetical protein